MFFISGSRGSVGASVEQLREQEQSLLLDPCYHDIAEHLSFDLLGHVRPKSEVGAVTIKVFALDREALVRQRYQRLRLVVELCSRDELLGLSRSLTRAFETLAALVLAFKGA